jgi:hypothetical protein
MNGNKFATGEILRKAVEVVKGRILAGLASWFSRTLLQIMWATKTRMHHNYCHVHNLGKLSKTLAGQP